MTAAIRPEKLVPIDRGAPPLGPAVNTCKGMVEEAIYVGDATRYRVALGADGALTVKVPNRLGAAAACRGRGRRPRLVAGRDAALSPRDGVSRATAARAAAPSIGRSRRSAATRFATC